MIDPARFDFFSRLFSRRAVPAVSASHSKCETAGKAHGLNGKGRLHRGSVLIIVVALLVLMAVIGTAYVSTARTDRQATASASFNTEIDLLVQGVESMAQNAIAQDIVNNFWTASVSPTNFTSPTQQTFLSPRVPVLINGNPGWMFISAAPMTSAVFESPYNQAGTSAAPAALQYGTDRQNMQISSVSVTDSTGMTVQYPALIDPKYPGVKFLAASAAGDGIADAGLFRLPIGEINGITYYAAVRIIDNNSAVNAATAWADNDTNPNVQVQSPNIYGNFTPANVNLLNLVADGQGTGPTGISALNNYRFNGVATPSLTAPIGDNGQARTDFNFISPYDALWMQLGRRLGNPGYITTTAKYQAVPMSECGTLAYHFCLPNSSASSSILEQIFPMSLRSGSMRTSPYSASDWQTWFNQNFNYTSDLNHPASAWMPRRALMTARNGTSNFTLNKFTSQGTYIPGAAYSFGDMVQVTGSPFNYVCIQPIAAGPAQSPDPYAPTLASDNLYWAVEPWADYVAKTPINTATFAQLWLAYWNVMTDSTGNVPVGVDSTLVRSPIRNPNETVQASGNTVAGSITPSGGDDTANIQAVINSAPPNSTVNFAAGTFSVSSTLTFQNNLTYTGAGGALPPSLTPPEVLKLRAALAAVNALTLRGGGTDVVSRLIYLGPPAATTASAGGSSTLNWTGANDSFLVTTPSTAQNITVQGLTFNGAGVKIDGNATHVNLIGDTIQNVTGTTQDSDPWDDALYIPGGFIASSVVACTISNVHGDEAMQILNPDQGTAITDNVVKSAWNGIHVDFYNAGAGTLVARNDVSQINRNAIEIQGNPNGLTVRDNYVHNWVTQSSNGDAHMGYSIATGGQGNNNANNITITNNVVTGDGDPAMGTPPNPAINFTAFEVMGNNASVSNNYSSNMGTAQLIDNWQLPTIWSTTNNIWCGLTGCANGQTTGAPVIAQNGMGGNPSPNTGNQTFVSANAVAPPHLAMNQPAPGTTTTTAPVDPSTTYSVMVYGTARNPYITKAYADNDGSISGGGYVAIELYNPYNTPISLKNWQLATLSRPNGTVVGVPLTPLASTQTQWGAGGSPPTIPAHTFLTLVSSSTPPPQYAVSGGPTASSINQVIVLSDLASALNNELVLLRTRRGDGTPTSSTDPANKFDETSNNPNATQDLVPVDSYDFSGLTTSTGGNAPVEWYYARPDDSTQNDAWHFVYPGAYNITASSTANATGVASPRLTATTSEAAGTLPSGLTVFGQFNPSGSSATLSKYNDTPLQLDNDQAPGPYPINAGSNAATATPPNTFPFGGFARDGDILHAPFIGAYRIQVTQSGELVELNPVTIDSTYAKIAPPATDAITPGENIGRFAPILPAFTAAGTISPTAPANDYSTNTNLQTPYHFATQLFDYLTVNAPIDWTPVANSSTWSTANLTSFAPDSASTPNVDPNPINPGSVPAAVYPTAPAPVLTLRASPVNPTCPTNDTIPTEGLININTAPWPVLATLPMSDSAATNAALAQAIVYFRDVDDGTTPGTPHPHGPFKTIWELNEVAVNLTSPGINGGGMQQVSTINNGQPISFLQTLGTYAANTYNPAIPIAAPNDPNECGEISPQPGNNNIYNDFESQNLALTRISNLITTRSDLYTVYVIVQGWRNVGTSQPTLVVQRRAAFLADRNCITDSNKQMTITNIPNE